MLYACKCPDKEKAEVFTPQDLDVYTKFRAGSWWVYENLDYPDIMDSLFIYNDRVLFRESDDKQCVSLEWYFENAIRIKSNGQIDSIRFELIPPFPISRIDTEYYYVLRTIKNNIYSSSISLLFTHNSLNEESHFGSATKIVDKQAKQTINGVEYNNTITTFHPDPQYVISEVYAENVGVVMRVYPDSSVFVLKDYFINQ